MTDVTDVERAFREAHGQAVATLTRVFGDIGLAEDAVQDAFLTALQRWPRDGVPDNCAGWIVTTARHRAVDVLRRDRRGGELTRLVASDRTGVAQTSSCDDPPVLPDDQLRLVFTCCHPAIRLEHQVALTLRLIAGLTLPELASAFLVSEEAMAKRLVRTKYKIKAAGIPYTVPGEADLPHRLRSVLSVLYLIYNTGADDVTRAGLRTEALRLTRILLRLVPDEPEVMGLLALMLLNDARIPSRAAGDEVVLLEEQDRSLWDAASIAEGQELVLVCLRRRQLGPFQLQAAIQALHCAAARYEDTDWAAVVRFYDRLLVVMPTPVVALNRAVAVAEVAGPGDALALVDAVRDELDGYHLLHAARGSLLARLGRRLEAVEAYDRAAALARTEAEIGFLSRRRAALAGDVTAPPAGQRYISHRSGCRPAGR